MSASISELERDIEASRARLDETIDRIQDRLTAAGLVDEVLGSARRTPLHGIYDGALVTVRRNPVPVLLIAAGIGLLLKGMTRPDRARGAPPTARPIPSDRDRAVPSAVEGPAAVSRAG